MKSVVIYTYFKTPPSNYNLFFFVQKEIKYRDDIDYIIVINGETYDPTIIFPPLKNLTILKRENKGFDFGGHNHALQYLKQHGRRYDYYFFMNSGVIGPIIPSYLRNTDGWHWSQIFIAKITEKVKLVGTTIVCLPPKDVGGHGPKVEGFFFMTDQIGLDVIQAKGTVFCDHPTKYDAIVQGEYGLSNCIIEKGYSIDCMLGRYQGIVWEDPSTYTMNKNRHPSRKNSFYGKSIQPYEVIFHKWFWHGEETVNFDIIQSYVEDVLS
jgi:hypothetical protein